jgi:hypothetical protein
MSIIISKEGKDARKLDKTNIAQEDYLQNYIHYNPESLPLYEIKEDLRLLILAREYSTKSGPIDALGVDQEGSIYVIETKLYKNPDKRLVLAQVLDYGASLWRTYEDSSEFLERLETAVSNHFGITLAEKIQTFYGIDTEAVTTLLHNIRRNLSNGEFRFVVLMDRLEDRLRDLITFVNQNSRFDIFGVELEFYKFHEYEILIPKLYGAEVKKEVNSSKAAVTRKKWDEVSFFEQAQDFLAPDTLESLRQLYEHSMKCADDPGWGTGQIGTFSPKFYKVSTLSLYTVSSNGKLSLNFKWISNSEKTAAIAERFGQALKQIPGFNMPDNFRERDVALQPEIWASHVTAFMEVVQSVIQEN